jgi:hypothetical protein
LITARAPSGNSYLSRPRGSLFRRLLKDSCICMVINLTQIAEARGKHNIGVVQIDRNNKGCFMLN